MLSSARIDARVQSQDRLGGQVVPAVVTNGRSLAASKVVAMSRPTTFAPRPRLNTISAIEP